MNNQINYDGGSFRDPSGRVFCLHDKVFRELDNKSYDNFLELSNNPFYKKLVNEGIIIGSNLINDSELIARSKRCIIEHNKINFISYCYEWSPKMLHDAAIHTLDLQIKLLDEGYSLKDATPYNIQFEGGSPIFIDIASIESWDKKVSWFAYNQFCQFFLYPLFAQRYANMSIRQILLSELEGLSFDKLIKVLPLRIKYNPKFFLDIGLPSLLSKIIKESASHDIIKKEKNNFYAKDIQKNNLRRLKKVISGLVKSSKSFWASYEDTKSYSDFSVDQKNKFIYNCLNDVDDSDVSGILDIGSNTGFYSKMVASIFPKTNVVAIDFDVESIDRLYRENSEKIKANILPLVIDITNPSPALGWNSEERKSFLNRAKFDVVLALAVIHHLRVSKNIPLEKIVELLASVTSKYLVIEYISKDDPMFHKLTAIRKKVFNDYTLNNFENFLSNFFIIKKKIQLDMKTRYLYFLEKK
ncbi:class I SAM-dependent methyltransferase [Patescibacteria group bacterium]